VDFPAVVPLRAGGVSVVVGLAGQVPRILHWGRDLGELSADGWEALRFTSVPATLNNAVDVPPVFSLWPTESEGWLGTQAHEGHLEGTATAPHPRLTGAEHSETPGGGAKLVVRLADDVSDVDIAVTYRLDAAGVLAVDTAMTRRVGTPLKSGLRYHLAGVSAMLPLPRRAAEILDFTGKWCRERAPQRRPVTFGSYVREVRRGKPGHDSPYLLTVGTPGFGFRSGEVWAVHVAWSGNQRYVAEQLPEGAGGTHAVVLAAANCCGQARSA